MMNKFEKNIKQAEFWVNYSKSTAVPFEHRRDAIHYANILIMRANGIDETK